MPSPVYRVRLSAGNEGIVTRNAQQRKLQSGLCEPSLRGLFFFVVSTVLRREVLNFCQVHRPDQCRKKATQTMIWLGSWIDFRCIADLLSTCPQPDTSRIDRPGRISSSSWWFHIHWTPGSCIQCYLEGTREDEEHICLNELNDVTCKSWSKVNFMCKISGLNL